MTATLQSAERRSSGTRRAQVITAARDLFLSKGFEQTSIKDITDIVGGSRRDIYEHVHGQRRPVRCGRCSP